MQTLWWCNLATNPVAGTLTMKPRLNWSNSFLILWFSSVRKILYKVSPFFSTNAFTPQCISLCHCVNVDVLPCATEERTLSLRQLVEAVQHLTCCPHYWWIIMATTCSNLYELGHWCLPPKIQPLPKATNRSDRASFSAVWMIDDREPLAAQHLYTASTAKHLHSSHTFKGTIDDLSMIWII